MSVSEAQKPDVSGPRGQDSKPTGVLKSVARAAIKFLTAKFTYASVILYGALAWYIFWQTRDSASARWPNAQLLHILALPAFCIYLIAVICANVAAARLATFLKLFLIVSLTPLALCSATTLAFAEEIVPDGPFAKQQCALMRAGFTSADASQQRKLANDFGQANGLCHDLENDLITLETWYLRVKSARAALLTVNTDPNKKLIILDGLSKETLLDGLKMYALFLVPTNWTAGGNDTSTLYASFRAFGKALGDQRGAVWLPDSANHPDRIDHDRNLWYCQRMQVPCDEGPVVILTADRPDRVLVDRKKQHRVWLQNFSPELTNAFLRGIEVNLPGPVLDFSNAVASFKATYANIKFPILGASARYFFKTGDTFSIFYIDKVLPNSNERI